jgi:chromosome segregation ATPase
MAKPLPVSDSFRSAQAEGTRPAADRRTDGKGSHPAAEAGTGLRREEVQELERLRDENDQLRALCLELEQALQESGTKNGEATEPVPEYESLLEEKSQAIRRLHQQVEDLQAALVDAEVRAAEADHQTEAQPHNGPAPSEEELLTLSEELENERRQLQEDEQTLMDQMREMEVGMARERAELARQRNDLQRLQAEVRHELERLERNGALQSKIESLKSKFQDVTARRGAARSDASAASAPSAPAPSVPEPPSPPAKSTGLMGRWFGQGGR